MSKKLVSLIVIVIAINFSQPALADQCNDISSKLSDSVSYKITTDSLQQISEAKLTVLGEHHYTHYFWKMAHIYSFLKKRNSQVNCMFSEISQDATDEQIQEVIDGQMNDVFYTPRRLGFGPLYESILGMGDGLVLVDAPLAELGVKQGETRAQWLYRRDTWMLERINKAFDGNECAGGIYNVGAGHIWDSKQKDDDYISFGARAKDEIEGTVVVEKVHDSRLDDCLRDVPSFVAPTSDPAIREVFGLDRKQSTADYVLYLRTIDTMPTLLIPQQ